MTCTRQYFLAPHVRACRIGMHVMLLDLKKDRYLGIDGRTASALSDCIVSWPQREAHPSDADCASEHSISEAERTKDLQQMLDEGIVTSEAQAPRPSLCSRPEIPETAVIVGYDEVKAPISTLHVVRFLRAAITATVVMRCCSFETIINRVAHRPQKKAISTGTTPARLRELVHIYGRLSPLLFSSSDECMANSLTLSEFLAAHDVFATWVFGVALEPFAAHCWLQSGNVVLNDSPENVRRYTPILAV